MTIQIINYSGLNIYGEDFKCTTTTFAKPQSLDSFNINILDLNDNKVWVNDYNDLNSIKLEKDIKNIGKMIAEVKNAKILVLLPQDLVYNYNRYSRNEQLKNTLSTLDRILTLLTNLCITTMYENTITLINGREVAAAFYFKNSMYKEISISDKSKKATTINNNLTYLTTLELKKFSDIMNFLNAIGLEIENKEIIPTWANDLKFFDDNIQLEVIEENKKVIELSQEKIIVAQRKIEENNKYKSILYINGTELVNVIFEILTEMLNCNLSEFEDKKKEDFSFVLNGLTFIGEIKGISSNVRSQNLSQLELHHQSFLDDHQEAENKNLRQLLIINHQRNEALENRDPVDIKQIELAKNYGSLIVETRTLLRLFEDYRAGKLTQNKCIELLTITRGILEYK